LEIIRTIEYMIVKDYIHNTRIYHVYVLLAIKAITYMKLSVDMSYVCVIY